MAMNPTKKPTRRADDIDQPFDNRMPDVHEKKTKKEMIALKERRPISPPWSISTSKSASIPIKEMIICNRKIPVDNMAMPQMICSLDDNARYHSDNEFNIFLVSYSGTTAKYDLLIDLTLFQRQNAGFNRLME